MLHNFLLGKWGGSRALYDVCARKFAVARRCGSGDADYGGVDDGRVGEEDSFEFWGCDLETADFDEFLS